MEGQPAPQRPRLLSATALFVCAVLPLAALSAVVFGLVATGWPPVLALDRDVAVGLHGPALDHPGWTQANQILTDWVWDPWAARLLLAIAVVWLLVRRKRLLALWVAATSAAATGVQQALKGIFGRARPHWTHPVDSAEYSALPSGHTMTAVVTCVLLLWLLRKAGVRAPLWWLALVVGCVSVAGVSFTRIWLGVHWLTDTVAGALAGLAVALGAVAGWNALAASRRWQEKGRAGRIPS